MPFTLIDSRSIPSGAANEDRFGIAGAMAWVVDGATDVLEVPLVGGSTDAEWFATRLDLALRDVAGAPPEDLAALPDLLAARLRSELEAVAVREAAGRHEHPSASGIIVRASPGGIDWLSIGDCSLLVERGGNVIRFGMDLSEAGDRRLSATLSAFHAGNDGATADAARQFIMPVLRSARGMMNLPDGYGVFSITPTPPVFVRTGRVSLERDDHILLASDGLMRLVDVFGRYTAPALMAAAVQGGLAPLLAELRAIESADRHGHRFPRAKTSDDATGLLLRAF